MNDIRYFIDILENLGTEPEVGDYVEIEAGDTLVETYIEDITEDGVVIKLDETALRLLIDAQKQYVAESAAARMSSEDFQKRADDLHERIKKARKDKNTDLANKLQQEHDDLHAEAKKGLLPEAEYQGRKVPLGKPMKGDVKKSKVYVRKPNGNIVKVNFGDKKMRIKKSNPKRRKSFRARHKCDNPGPRWKAKYWSCRAW